MIYQMLLDGQTLYYSGDSECVVLDPEISLKMNEAGSAKMSIPKENPLYNVIHIKKSMLTVLKNNVEVFYGEVQNYTRGMDLSRKLTAVGALSFLNYSQQPAHNYGNATPVQFIDALLAIHNSQMDPGNLNTAETNRRKIRRGNVTVSISSNLQDKITNNESTLVSLRKNLVDVYGGILRIRHQSGNLYLDYINLSEFNHSCNQAIELGENLMDYTEEFDASNVKTAIIPYGARIEDNDSEFEKRVDITSKNSGKNYLLANAGAIQSYGYVWTTVNFDSVDNPSTLKSIAQTYLTETQFEKSVFSLSAVDLSAVNADISTIYFGDRIAVRAPLFGMDAVFPIIEMVMKPLKPEDERIVVSGNLRKKKVTLTGRLNAESTNAITVAKVETQKIAQVLRKEIANIMATFAGEYGGYKLEEYDENGLWLRTLIMDAPDKDDATNILEFSLHGIRASTGGYKAATDPAWKLAITLDGKIAAKEVLSNIIIAELLKVGIIQDVAQKTSFNLETGALNSKKLSITSPNFILQEDGAAEMTNAVINDGTVTTRGTKIIGGIMHHKETIVESGILTGIDNDRQTGVLDLAASYADNREHVVLQSEADLHLQSGDPTNGGMEIIIDLNGLHAQGLSGAYQLQSGETLELDGGLIVDIY